MLLARAGREEAFAALVRRHQGAALRVAARSLGGDAALAKEAAQRAFVELYRDKRKQCTLGVAMGAFIGGVALQSAARGDGRACGPAHLQPEPLAVRLTRSERGQCLGNWT